MQAINLLPARGCQANDRKKSATADRPVFHITLRGEVPWSTCLSGKGEALAVHCEAGILWITREGDGVDYILRKGEMLEIRGPGRIVISAIKAGAFSFK